tara:strand:- start:303 stop:965 length:663 start_codon:yes stop_codon:yes gene_type:complete
MKGSSAKGVEIFMSVAGATPLSLVPTAISAANPAVASVSDTSTLLAGQAVAVSGTGFSEIDGRTFIIGTVVEDTSIVLVGSDTSGSTEVLKSSPLLQVYESDDVQLLCLASLAISSEVPATISTATYCDPSSSIPSAAVQAGTIAITGWIDPTCADYQQIILAEDDGLNRIFYIVLPNNMGTIMTGGEISTLAYDIPIDGALGFSTTLVCSTKPVHLFTT